MTKHTTEIVSTDKRPSAFMRLRSAVQFYRHGWRGMLHAPESVKRFPYIWPGFRTGGQPVWQLTDFMNYAEEGFEANALIYSAIMYKARAASLAPLRAYTGTPEDREELDADHPLAKLVSRPNPLQGWAEFIGLCEVYYNLAGNCYIYVDRQGARANDGVPTAMWPMRPDRVRIVPRRGFGGRAVDVIGYIYVPEGCGLQDGVPFLPADMMHIKLPNPLDPLDGLGEGMSPIAPLARSGDVDNAVTKYLKLFFQKGGMPPGMMVYDNPLDELDIPKIKAAWSAVFGGVDNWTDILVADSGAKYQQLGLKFNEMGFEGIDSRNESRILMPFGVPQILLGTRLGLQSATFANYELARRAFWEDTMMPEHQQFEVEFKYFLQGDGDEFVAFDFSEVSGLKEDQVEKATIAQAAFVAGAITRNEYRAELGWDKVDDGDVYLVSPMLMAVPQGTDTGLLEPSVPQRQDQGTQDGAPAAEDEMDSTEGDAPKA